MSAPTAVISRRAELQEKKTAVMLVMPVVLILSTYAAFKLFDAWWGYPAGYLAGFAFYWIFWCLVFPVYILGGVRPVLSLFKEGTPSIRRLGWKAQLLLWLWIAFPLFTIFIPRAAGVGVVILGVSLLIGVVIGVTEELLWRGSMCACFPTAPG